MVGGAFSGAFSGVIMGVIDGGVSGVETGGGVLRRGLLIRRGERVGKRKGEV